MTMPYSFWHPILFQPDVDPSSPPKSILALTPAPGGNASGTAKLAHDSYGYVKIAWPAASTSLTVTLTGADTSRLVASADVHTSDGTHVAPAAGTARYTITRDPGGPDAVVEIAVANGYATTLDVGLSASA
jgi:hypothetical protein